MCVQLAPKKPTDPKEKSENTDPTEEKPKATKAGPKKANGADKEAGKHRASCIICQTACSSNFKVTTFTYSNRMSKVLGRKRTQRKRAKILRYVCFILSIVCSVGIETLNFHLVPRLSRR